MLPLHAPTRALRPRPSSVRALLATVADGSNAGRATDHPLGPRRNTFARGPIASATMARESASSYVSESLPWDGAPHLSDDGDPHHGTRMPPLGEPPRHADPAQGSCSGPSLRDAIIDARAAMVRVRDLVATSTIGGGEVGGLLDLLTALDAGQAAGLTLAARVQHHRLAPRATGLTLDSLLACQAPLPDTDRRRLLRTADVLRTMPKLSASVTAGDVPAAALTAITSEARRLRRADRAALDDAFDDHSQLGSLDAEQVVDAVRDAVRALAPDEAERDDRRPVEDRFLSVQPRLDGTLTGYFELDAEGGATVLEAIEAASPLPSSGPKDVTTHALDGHPNAPSTPSNWPRRAPGRARADALVNLAEDFLAGIACRAANCPPTDPDPGSPDGPDTGRSATSADTPNGPSIPGDGTQPRTHRSETGHRTGEPHDEGCHRRSRRPRPRVLVFADIDTLTGNDATAQAARLLWVNHAGPAKLTPSAVRRLASDADLRFILHRDGELLGTTAPTPTIPNALRDAVHARDHGCRFPGCRVPVRHVDLHHVIPRESGGPTTPENLASLCRRHHTAVTTGAWSLSMTPQGTVTVRRGRRTAVSEPPHRRRLRLQPRPRPG